MQYKCNAPKLVSVHTLYCVLLLDWRALHCPHKNGTHVVFLQQLSQTVTDIDNVVEMLLHF